MAEMGSGGVVKDRRGPGWWWAHNEVIDDHAKNIGPHGLAVYATLCRHANRDGCSWPSIRRVADLLSMGRNTVRAAMTRLADAALIRIEPRIGPDGDQESNVYILTPLGTWPSLKPGGSTAGGGVGPQRDGGGSTAGPEGNSGKETHVKDGREGGVRRRKKPATPFPPDFALTPERRAFAKAGGFSDDDVELMFGAFRDHHLARGTLFSDWDAGWRKWCRKELDIRHDRQQRGPRR